MANSAIHPLGLMGTQGVVYNTFCACPTRLCAIRNHDSYSRPSALLPPRGTFVDTLRPRRTSTASALRSGSHAVVSTGSEHLPYCRRQSCHQFDGREIASRRPPSGQPLRQTIFTPGHERPSASALRLAGPHHTACAMRSSCVGLRAGRRKVP